MKNRSIQDFIADQLLVKAYSGSHAYGMALPTSDVDFRGIFCSDMINVRTPFFPIKEIVDSSEEDTKFFELTHFMKLCVECNPNIIELLWTDADDVVVSSPEYEYLRSVRHELISSKIAFTTSGYAIAQLKRIKGHNKWINNPQPKAKPMQKDFVSLVYNMTDAKVLPSQFNIDSYRAGYRLLPYGNNIFGIYESSNNQLYDDAGALITNYDSVTEESWMTMVGENGTERRRKPLFIIKYNIDEYKSAKETHSNYWDWKANRNEKRSELEEQFGFDTKHASHLVRLLRMGEEALTTGQILVKRPDAQELLDIRHGKWSYEQIIEYAEYMDERVRGDLYKHSILPKKPNIQRAAQILMDVQDMVWYNK